MPWGLFSGKQQATDRPSGEVSSRSDTGLLAHLLLVVDGAPPSIAAANFAVRLAAETGGRITAVYVVDTATMDYLMQMRILVRDEREEFERDLGTTGERYLQYAKTIATKHGVEIEPEMRRGSFHRTILDRARELGVDIIVLGGWRKSITRKDVTSVERQLILDEAVCPVIVVHEDDRDGRASHG